MLSLSRDEFLAVAAREAAACAPGATLAIPVALRLLSDQITPVSAYRRLVSPDERTAPSFLLESVENGDRQGRHSIMGSRPVVEVIARGRDVTVRRAGAEERRSREGDPLLIPRRLTAGWRLVRPAEHPRARLPRCALGGWFGFAAYDTVRYAEPDKLAPERAPRDDRGLPDLHFSYYDGVVVFDHVDRVAHIIRLVEAGAGAGRDAWAGAYDRAAAEIGGIAGRLETPPAQPGFRLGRLSGEAVPGRPSASNLTREEHAAMVARAKEYIASGDIFQVVIGQRFERRSAADPFDVYRALRTVNPSPYMVYMQGEGTILVASSPEILCRVRRDAERGALVVTNRPLAGTRPRGATAEEDEALERELLSDDKERAEHIMLVDLGRNDVGRVCEPRTVRLPAVMQVERYSHVMHISSTVTGELREGLDCWDALRAALPVGTISGAPKIRAMQVIDELEPVRRGPYGGGMGYVGLDGEMDIALALRTIVTPTAQRTGEGWVYHLQAAGGIVADSRAEAEYDETVNKAAALARAIDLAESAFGG